MQKLWFQTFLFLFVFIFPTIAQAFQVSDTFESTQTGLLYEETPVISTIGTITGNTTLQQVWVEILSSTTKCHNSSTCISGYRASALYDFNDDTVALMYVSDIDYISFYVYIPQNDVAINTNVSSWNYTYTANSIGNMSLEYFHFCKTTDFSYSLVLSTSANAINNCDNETYGQKIGQGVFGQWQKVDFRLNSTTGTIQYRLNSSGWSNTVSVDNYDLYFGKIQWQSNALFGTSIYYEDDDIDTYRIDDLVVSDFDSENLFDLNYTIGLVNEDWTEENVGCDINVKEYCGIATTSYAIAIQGQATSTVPLWKYEYELSDIDGVALEPQGAFSKSTIYPLAQSIVRTDPVIFPDTDKRIYLLRVCIGYQYDYPLAFGSIGTMSVCKHQWIGNGYTDDLLGQMLVSLGKIASTTGTGSGSGVDLWNSQTAWETNGCDDIGITDVFKGVKCALIWAFAPSQDSLQKFNEAKNSVLTLYPIGYATLILADVNNAFTSTSTTAFDKDIDVKKFFGQTGGTTTISVSNLTSELGMVEPIINYGEMILWTLFVGWLLVWGLTRKL
jgi:hypothetical protein